MDALEEFAIRRYLRIRDNVWAKRHKGVIGLAWALFIVGLVIVWHFARG